MTTTTTSQNTVKNSNQVLLVNSTWTGQVSDGNDDTIVSLDKQSQWHVTSGTSSKVERLSFVDKDSVVALQKGAHLNVGTSTGNARFKFEALDDTSVSVANVKADSTTVIAAGNLNDGTLSREGIADGLQKAYNGSSTDAVGFEIEQGLVTNGSTGYFDEKGGAHFTTDTTNTNLLTAGETAAVTMMQWRAEADDLNQRMGELRDSTADNGLWVRTYGGKMEANSVDNEFVGFQFGYDHNVSEGAQKQFVGGALSYTSGDAKFANGSGDNYALGLTGYGTWLFEGGTHLDVSAKYGKLNNKFDINAGDFGKLNGDYSTHGLAFNVEAGHRIPLTSLFYVEPQVAFTASHIFGEDYDAGQGVSISQDSFESYVARAGIATGFKGDMGSLWMKASYLYDFDGQTSTTAKAGSVANKLDQDFGGGWYELGIGASVNLAKNLHGYADFEYATGGEIETPYKWNVGIRYTY